jgi:hypothetical protein
MEDSDWRRALGRVKIVCYNADQDVLPNRIYRPARLEQGIRGATLQNLGVVLVARRDLPEELQATSSTHAKFEKGPPIDADSKRRGRVRCAFVKYLKYHLDGGPEH